MPKTARKPRNGEWTKAEIAILRDGIRKGKDRHEIATSIDGRSYGAVCDKLLKEARILGITPPKRIGSKIGRPGTGSMLPKGTPAIGRTDDERSWVAKARRASAQYLEAINRYFDNRRRAA